MAFSLTYTSASALSLYHGTIGEVALCPVSGNDVLIAFESATNGDITIHQATTDKVDTLLGSFDVYTIPNDAHSPRLKGSGSAQVLAYVDTTGGYPFALGFVDGMTDETPVAFLGTSAYANTGALDLAFSLHSTMKANHLALVAVVQDSSTYEWDIVFRAGTVNLYTYAYSNGSGSAHTLASDVLSSSPVVIVAIPITEPTDDSLYVVAYGNVARLITVSSTSVSTVLSEVSLGTGASPTSIAAIYDDDSDRVAVYSGTQVVSFVVDRDTLTIGAITTPETITGPLPSAIFTIRNSTELSGFGNLGNTSDSPAGLVAAIITSAGDVYTGRPTNTTYPGANTWLPGDPATLSYGILAAPTSDGTDIELRVWGISGTVDAPAEPESTFELTYTSAYEMGLSQSIGDFSICCVENYEAAIAFEDVTGGRIKVYLVETSKTAAPSGSYYIMTTPVAEHGPVLKGNGRQYPDTPILALEYVYTTGGFPYVVGFRQENVHTLPAGSQTHLYSIDLYDATGAIDFDFSKHPTLGEDHIGSAAVVRPASTSDWNIVFRAGAISTSTSAYSHGSSGILTIDEDVSSSTPVAVLGIPTSDGATDSLYVVAYNDKAALISATSTSVATVRDLITLGTSSTPTTVRAIYDYISGRIAIYSGTEVVTLYVDHENLWFTGMITAASISEPLASSVFTISNENELYSFGNIGNTDDTPAGLVAVRLLTNGTVQTDRSSSATYPGVNTWMPGNPSVLSYGLVAAKNIGATDITIRTWNIEGVFNLPGIGEADITIPALVVSGAGDYTGVHGEGAINFRDFEAEAVGTSPPIPGSGAVQMWPFQCAGYGAGLADISLPAFSVSGTGVAVINGNGAIKLPRLLASGSGTAWIHGSGSLQLPIIDVSGTGQVAISGAGLVTLSAFTVAGSGVMAAGDGTGAVTLNLFLVSGRGTLVATEAAIAFSRDDDLTPPGLAVVSTYSEETISFGR